MSNLHTKFKKDWRKVDLTFGLVYPNIYELGISSYSLRLIYSMINNHPHFLCESFFIPSKRKYPANRDPSPISSIRSIESGILAFEFDIIGFSLQYENDYPNVLWFLEKSKLPLTISERNKNRATFDKKYPILIGGGVAATSNPLPLSKFLDVFFIGDAEPNLMKFLERVVEFKEMNLEYETLLNEAKKIEGIFLPYLKNQVKRSVYSDLNSTNSIPHQITVQGDNKTKAFEKNLLIEVNRGCPFKCKFCLSSFHNSPFRNKSFETIKKNIIFGINHVKFNKISLIGSCVSSHPQFLDICQFIFNQGYQFSIPSIRIEHINNQLISILEQAKIKTITIAPETASENLRYFTGKNISNKLIFDVLIQIQASKIRNVKLYFLIGLPSETDADIYRITDFIKKVDQIGFQNRSLRVNINPFVPKLNTPFQYYTTPYLESNLNSFISKLKRLEKDLRKIPSVKLRFTNPKKKVRDARIQTSFSVGDESFSNLLLHYYRNGANYQALKKSEEYLNLSIDGYLLQINNGYIPWKL